MKETSTLPARHQIVASEDVAGLPASLRDPVAYSFARIAFLEGVVRRVLDASAPSRNPLQALPAAVDERSPSTRKIDLTAAGTPRAAPRRRGPKLHSAAFDGGDMKTIGYLAVIVTVLLLAGVPAAHATLVFSSFPVDLYETLDNTPGGTPSEIGPVVTLPQPVSAGFVVLLESGDPSSASDRNDLANWSDVVDFINRGDSFAETVRLHSDPFPGNLPALFETIIGATNTVFILEGGPSGTDYPTIYLGLYRIFSLPPARDDVPQPASVILLTTAILAFGAYHGVRRRR